MDIKNTSDCDGKVQFLTATEGGVEKRLAMIEPGEDWDLGPIDRKTSIKAIDGDLTLDDKEVNPGASSQRPKGSTFRFSAKTLSSLLIVTNAWLII